VRVTAAFADGRPPVEPAEVGVPERTLVHPLPPVVPPGALLRVTAGPAAGGQVALDGRPVTIGRAADADLVVGDPLVSRHHARLAPRSGRLVLSDLGSTNGTIVNGQAVRESVVGPGDRIQLGSTRLEIVVPGGANGR
jgi:pSer/pThr/pTyr-binding forkhead associated (FHA) protein